MKKLKVLELFAGTRSIGKAFEDKGHKVYSIEWDKQHDNIDWYVDIGTITAQDIIDRFGIPDVIWCSPDCSSYSVAGISHHRRKDENGNLTPISDYAKFCDKVNQHVIDLIKELKPKLYFIENPRGGLRKMNFMKGLPRYTTTYCQYGEKRMKPTDLWTNHPNPKFKPPCHNGDKCHEPAPRGSRTGTQGIKGSVDRARIPKELCEHVVNICEEYINTYNNKNIIEKVVDYLIKTVQEESILSGFQYVIDYKDIKDIFGVENTEDIKSEVIKEAQERKEIADIICDEEGYDVVLYTDYAPNYEEDSEE